MEFLFFWFMFAVIVGVLASGRGRLGFGWFLLACIISPLIAGLLVLVLPRLNAPQPAPATADATAATAPAGALRPCPQCAEPIQPQANKCRHCGADVVSSDVRAALFRGDSLNLDEVEVVGEARYQPALDALAFAYAAIKAPQPLTAQLVREPGNPYDSNAVRVDIASRPVGYLPRDLAYRFEKAARRHYKLNGPLPAIPCPADIRTGKTGIHGVVVYLPEPLVEALHA
jgi:hypothetical protein